MAWSIFGQLLNSVSKAPKQVGSAATKIGQYAGKAAAPVVSAVGTGLRLPEYNISEFLGGQPMNQSSTVVKKSGGTQSDGGGGDPTGGSGALTGFGGGTGTTGPTVAGVRPEVASRIARLNEIYNSIYGGVDNMINDKRSRLQQEYQGQIGTLSDSYGKASRGLDDAYASRGLTDSSYRSVAQGDAKNEYDANLGSIESARQNNEAELGRTAVTTKGGYQADQNQVNSIDLNAITDVSALEDLRNTLDEKINNASQALSGIGTNAQFVDQLNRLAPAALTAPDALKNMLAKVVQSQAPIAAKNEIAQKIIGRSELNGPDAQQYWNDYFSKLMGA